MKLSAQMFNNEQQTAEEDQEEEEKEKAGQSFKKHKVKMKKQICKLLFLILFFLAQQTLSCNCDIDESQPFESGAKKVKRPTLAPNQERQVVASRWQSEVFLPCKILNLDELQTVSWIRKRDSLVLTIDKLKLIEDSRFQLAQNDHDWTLVISQPNNLDAGLYECQVSSMEPKLSRLIELRMVEANSRILNPTGNPVSSLVVRPNERLNVSCIIEAPQQTDFVYWYKNKETIHFDNLRQRALAVRSAAAVSHQYGTDNIGLEDEAHKDDDDDDDDDDIMAPGRTASARKAPQEGSSSNSRPPLMLRTSSSLIIKRTTLNDTANYTCLPSNAKPSHISIFVIENGAQSQPEKRSLQVGDGVAAPFNSPRIEAHFIAIQMKKKLLRSLQALINLILDYSKPNVIQNLHIQEDEQSMMSLIVRLASNEDLIRLVLTIIVTIYVANH